MYLVIDFIDGRERGINSDLTAVAPETAELLTADEARGIVDRLRAAGRKGHAVTEGRYFGTEPDPADYDF